MAGRIELLWPQADERRLLGRFYVAAAISRALYLVYPFEFAYLFLVMRRPEWAVLPLMAMSAAGLATQVPTGVVADRWSRKGSVLAGGALSAATFLAVPWAVNLGGDAQLLGACGALAAAGVAQTLMAGAQEAWVVDNLRHAGRDDLIETFFARTYAVSSVGGVLAGVAALAILLVAHVDRAVLDALWYATAAGYVAAVAVAAGIAEHRVAGGAVEVGMWSRTRGALVTVLRKRVLMLLIIAMVIAALSAAGAEEAFPVALLTKGLDARTLAPLGIADDLIGIGAPILGLVLARRYGATPVLSVSLVVAGAVATVLLAARGVVVVLALYVALGVIDRMWDPVALARLQREIPSAYRATIGSLTYQASGLAELAGLGMFAVLLGTHSQQLRDATPDLVEAFSGHAHVSAPVPTIAGLPLPDLAIVVFVVMGVLAVPFVVAAAHRRADRPPDSTLGEERPPVTGPPPPAPGRPVGAATGGASDAVAVVLEGRAGMDAGRTRSERRPGPGRGRGGHRRP